MPKLKLTRLPDRPQPQARPIRRFVQPPPAAPPPSGDGAAAQALRTAKNPGEINPKQMRS